MRLFPVCLLVLLAACASLEVSGLVAGQSSEADVLSAMGEPAQTLSAPDGGKLLYFSRLPEGRRVYRASVAPDGRLRGIEQLLTPENIRRVAVGQTAAQVRELLGPPGRVTRYRFKAEDVWEYKWLLGEDRRILWVAFSDNGAASSITDLHDYESDPPSGPDKD